ncbi:3737_t:CDS:1, partial [Racocetra persica]
GARQELARREYLCSTGIDLGYTEPLNEGVINADKNAQLRRDREVIIVEPLEINNEPL